MIKHSILKFTLLYCVCSNFVFGFELDKKVKKDDNGFWGAHYDIPKYSAIAVIGVAVTEGTETRFGKTSWQSLEAGITSQIFTEGIKEATGRKRPRQTDNPNDWDEDGKSFVSAHVSGMTALVTPYILEYSQDTMYVHALWLLPAYQMVGRVKAQAHWQSDVIGGALVGFGSGYISHKYDLPFLFYFDGDKKYVGLRYRF